MREQRGVWRNHHGVGGALTKKFPLIQHSELLGEKSLKPPGPRGSAGPGPGRRAGGGTADSAHGQETGAIRHKFATLKANILFET